MKAWFVGLQPRERMILIGGAAVAVVLLLWLAVLKPLHSQAAILRESVAAKQRLLVSLAQIDGQSPGHTVSPGTGQTLVVLVSNTAQQQGIALTRTRPDGPDGIQVTFSNVSFDTLVAWLVALESENSVAVESASFTSGRQQGVVNGQLLLRRS